MTDGIGQVNETRGRLLALLRRSDRSVGELAEAVGVSGNAIRSHLAGLERDGLVAEAGLDRDTGGKPARLYRLTREAEDLFPKAYAFALGELIRLLEERQGRDAVVELLREVGRRAAADGDEAGPAAARVEAAAEALRTLGGAVDVERTESGWCLRGHGCPLSRVVSDQPHVCVLAESLVEAITGRSAVARCEYRPRPRCRVEVAG